MANQTGPDHDKLILSGTFGSRKRSGTWSVPPLIVIQTRMGSTELDFTQADFPAAGVQIEVTMFGGSIEFRVPKAAVVDTSAVTTRLASVEDHRHNLASDGSPRITITGALTWGSLEIRGPR